MNRLLDLKLQIDRLVLTQLPSASTSAIDHEINEVIRDFYVTTQCWRTGIGPFTRQEGAPYIVLGAPQGASIVAVHEVTRNGYSLGTRTGGGTDWHWAADRPELLTLGGPATAHEYGQYGVEVSLVPINPDVIIPETAVSHHLGTIVAGILWRMYNQPTKPWYNPAAAAVQFRDWKRGLGVARMTGVRGYAPGPLMAHNPFGTFV